MKVIVFEEEAYYKMLREFANMVDGVVKNQEKEKEWLDANEAKQLLGIKSTSKLQKLRNNGDILISQHGRIIKYSTKSIKEYLKRGIQKR
ncbi:helix-turn-helix domain-containing protein [bacterium]|nr:helix-turn-helix domain-containing protein [bacterium]